MPEDISSYSEFEKELTNLLHNGKEGGLDGVLLAGILLDYRDHIRRHGELPGHERD